MDDFEKPAFETDDFENLIPELELVLSGEMPTLPDSSYFDEMPQLPDLGNLGEEEFNQPIRRRKVRQPHKIKTLSEEEKTLLEMLKAMVFTIIEDMKTNPQNAPLVRRIEFTFKQIICSNKTFTHWFNRRLRHYGLNSSKERVNEKKVSIQFLNDLHQYIELRIKNNN